MDNKLSFFIEVSNKCTNWIIIPIKLVLLIVQKQLLSYHINFPIEFFNGKIELATIFAAIICFYLIIHFENLVMILIDYEYEIKNKIQTHQKRQETQLNLDKNLLEQEKNIINSYQSSINKLKREKEELYYKLLNAENSYSYDSLTTLFTRKYFNSILTTEFFISKKKDKPISIIMLDIDNFKSINDKYGHQTGDTVLSSIGKHIKSLCAQNIIPARYGGEEIIIASIGLNNEEIYDFAEGIRKSIENLHIENCPKITVSIGIASLNNLYDNFNTEFELIKAADKALYKAKNTGKNKVVSYKSPY